MDHSFTDVRNYVPMENFSDNRTDDLGVIAEVIVCDSFVAKFAANSTQKFVLYSFKIQDLPS